MNWRLILLFFVAGTGSLSAQKIIEKKKFFTDGYVLEMSIITDFKKLINEKYEKDYKLHFQPATINCVFPDSTKVTEEAEVRVRGEFRRQKCDMPPLIVNFKTAKSVTFKKLGHLKLVWPCNSNRYDEQLILKEYIGYKIYNLLTEKSFRVRLVKINYRDVQDRIKPYSSFGFFIEDVDDMAKRNGCVEVQSGNYQTEQTDREQTTMVALFQYMIGNTDWAIPVYQNIKLIRGKNDMLSWPYVVPYDFDYCGLVNAKYALPIAEFGKTTIRERVYRGFPRTVAELQASLDIFRRQKWAIDSLIVNFGPLTSLNKKDIGKYINDFFELTKKEKDVSRIFIGEARLE